MAADGLRVLAVGMRDGPALPPDDRPGELERELTLLGLVGMLDPPRDEAREAVETCRQAGIVPVMITGDHPTDGPRSRGVASASSPPGDEVLTGRGTCPRLSATSWRARVGHIRVYARVAPEQKLQIVRALQARGEIVAMTGDGVNDAPALKQADIGVAMGITGTDVSQGGERHGPPRRQLRDDRAAPSGRAARSTTTSAGS